MPARVFVLPATSAHEIIPLNPGIVSGLQSTADPLWLNLTTSLVRTAQRAPAMAPEIFVCLTGEGIAATDRFEAQEILRHANDACWGVPAYLVLGSKSYDVPQMRDERDALWEWLTGLSRQFTTDVLFIPSLSRDTTSIRLDDLRRACDSGRRRRDLARALIGSGAWRCVDRLRGDVLRAPLVGELVQRERAEDEGANLILPVDCARPKRERAFLQRMLQQHPDREYVGIHLSGAPAGDLEVICKKLNVRELLRFSSELELWYFLVRLNAHPAKTVHPDITFVPAKRGSAFRRPPPPVVLVTQSFAPHEVGWCGDAACDLAWIRRELSTETVLFTDIAVTPARLIALLKQHPDVNAWIHMGHGEPSGELRAADGSTVSPERWLKCFEGRSMPLSLAVFLTCHSTRIARHFADAGAAMGIGFEEEVLSRSCRLLACEVLAQWSITPWDVTGAYWRGANAVEADLGGRAKAFVPRR